MSRIKQRLDLTRPSGGPIIRVRRRRKSGPTRPGTRRPREEQADQPLEQATQQEAQPAAQAEEQQLQQPEQEAQQPQAGPQAEQAEQAEQQAASTAGQPVSPQAERPTESQPAAVLEVTAESAPEPVPAAEAGSAAARESAGDAVPQAATMAASEPEPLLARQGAPAPATLAAARAPEDTLQRDRGDWRSRVAGLRTTGIFTVPQDTVLQLVVAVSSFADEEETATVSIRRVEGDELETIFFRSLTVPPGGAQRVIVDGLDGQTIAVDVQLSSDLLVPTATVTQFFPADGATVVLVYKSAGDFIPV